MMWKALIADDEPKIRHGLRALLEKHAPEFELAAEAEDGENAYQLALATRPDLLLIDICMPFRNGLELIESLDAALPGRIVIVISGHDEFNYAQAAVKLKVFDYLLKPVSESVFASAIARAGKELADRAESKRYESWMREQLDKNLPVLRERFFSDWVKGSLSRSEVEEGLAFLDIKLEAPSTLVASRYVELLPGGPGSERARRLALVAMRAVLAETIPGNGSYVFEDGIDTVLAVAPEFREAELLGILEAIEARAAIQAMHVPHLASRIVNIPILGMDEAYEEICSELSVGAACEAFVTLARNYVDKHYFEPDLNLERAAGELQISPGYLSRLMKRETGFSFVEYVNHIRVKKATQLMTDPSAKVFEVAERVGYKSQHYFSRAFKKVMGVAPTEVRKRGGS